MSRRTINALQASICAWLDANHIPHADVPFAAVPTIVDNTITIDIYNRRDGKLYLDAAGVIAGQQITVPLKVPPPPELAEWIAGKVTQ